MLSLPEDILTMIIPFSQLFSESVWHRAQLLWIGAILCRKQRTVAAVLRILGLGQESGFDNYHHVLSRAKWSSLQAGKILLGLLVVLIPPTAYIIISIDETFERRKGKKIVHKGSYRDPIRSSQKHVVYCFGLKWICMMVIIYLPLVERHWALPFLTVLAPSKAYNKQMGKRHKTTIDWAAQMVRQVSRWIGDKLVLLVADGGFASIYLAHVCIQCGWALVSKLRLDAQLYDFPPPQTPHKRGPKPQKGNKLIPLKDRIEETRQKGREVTVKWYGGKRRRVCYLSEVCLWYTPSQTPIKIRWVLVVDPQGKLRSEAFFSTHVELSPVQIIETYVLRWNEEVTFEESRAHLGIETQRQWSPKAIQRTTPALLALFSIVTLVALKLSKTQKLLPQKTAWYQKKNPTFSDLLTQVRYHIWKNSNYVMSNQNHDFRYFENDTFKSLLMQLANAA